VKIVQKKIKKQKIWAQLLPVFHEHYGAIAFVGPHIRDFVTATAPLGPSAHLPRVTTLHATQWANPTEPFPYVPL